jgi:hypothetical protein
MHIRRQLFRTYTRQLAARIELSGSGLLANQSESLYQSGTALLGHKQTMKMGPYYSLRFVVGQTTRGIYFQSSS